MYQRYHQVWTLPATGATQTVYWDVSDGAVAGYTGPGPGWVLVSNVIEEYDPHFAPNQQPYPASTVVVPSNQPIIAPPTAHVDNVITQSALGGLTVNGYTQNDQTAIAHATPSDPWFHFYWPKPGEVINVSWWLHDDRNNPTIGYVVQNGLLREIPAAAVPGTPGATYAPGATGVITQSLDSATANSSGSGSPPAISATPGVPGGTLPAGTEPSSPKPAGGVAPSNTSAPLPVPWYKRPYVELAIAAAVLWLIFTRA